MEDNSLLEDVATYRAQVDAAAGALQVALIYEDELDLDYSRVIKGLNSVAKGAYHLGRETLERVENKGVMYENSSPLPRNDIFRGHKSDTEWVMLEDPGAAGEALETHLERVRESEEGLGQSISGVKLRESLESYEELVEAANDVGVGGLEPIEEPLKDEALEGDIVEDDDAVLF